MKTYGSLHGYYIFRKLDCNICVKMEEEYVNTKEEYLNDKIKSQMFKLEACLIKMV